MKFIHDFVVTEQLVAPVISGVDFFHNKGLVLDFTNSPVSVHHLLPEEETLHNP